MRIKNYIFFLPCFLLLALCDDTTSSIRQLQTNAVLLEEVLGRESYRGIPSSVGLPLTGVFVWCKPLSKGKPTDEGIAPDVTYFGFPGPQQAACVVQYICNTLTIYKMDKYKR